MVFFISSGPGKFRELYILSLVIPLYNSEKYISECLDSLLDQDVSKNEYEIIIINDGSKDKSLQIVENYAKNNPNIVVYSQENKGVAATRNKGIKMAKGSFIFFVDSDDYIATDVLEVIFNNLDNSIELLTFKSIQTIQTNLKISQDLDTIKSPSIIIDGIDFIAKYGFKDAIGWFVVNKDFLIKSNLFYLEGKMLEDISFNIKLLTTVKKILHLPLDVYRYVARENSIMTKKNATHFKNIISDYERIISELEVQIQKFKTELNMYYQFY